MSYHLRAFDTVAYMEGFFYITEDYIYSRYKDRTGYSKNLADNANYYNTDDPIIEKLNNDCIKL